MLFHRQGLLWLGLAVCCIICLFFKKQKENKQLSLSSHQVWTLFLTLVCEEFFPRAYNSLLHNVLINYQIYGNDIAFSEKKKRKKKRNKQLSLPSPQVSTLFPTLVCEVFSQGQITLSAVRLWCPASPS